MPPDDMISNAQSTVHSTTRSGHRGEPHYPPPPMSAGHNEELDGLQSIHHEKFPSYYPGQNFLPKVQEGDEFYLGSDDEDDWDDFEDVSLPVNVAYRLSSFSFQKC